MTDVANESNNGSVMEGDESTSKSQVVLVIFSLFFICLFITLMEKSRL